MKLIVTHDVDDVEHWFNSPKREELFGPLGISVTPFRSPGGDGDGDGIALLFDTPDMETFEAALEGPDAEAAMAYDGVHPDTIKVFVAE